MDIKKKYHVELNRINNHLTGLENGRIYEVTRTPGTPSYTTIAKYIRDDLEELLSKIENEEPGIFERKTNAGSRV